MSTDVQPTAPAQPTPSPSASSSQTYTSDELRQDAKLWYKLHVFMYDLRAFRSNSDSRTRLDSVVSTYYIGEPYFSASEAERVLHTIFDGNTLKHLLDEFFEKKLEKRLEGRMKETADYRVCAAHDIAPIVEKVFGMRPGDLKQNKGFVKLVEKGGLSALDAGAVWKGIGRR